MIIIKIGGGNGLNIEGAIKDLSELKEPFIILHGANTVRDELAEALNKPKKVITSLSGYQSVFSDEFAIDVMMMAYAGLKNKRIVELCQQNGINAIGLSGLDGKSIQGIRNKGIKLKEGEKILLKRDYSGKPKSVNKELLQLLLDNGYVPVLCVPIIDENNTAINTENDSILNILQQAFNAEKIISLIEAPGFLEHKDDPNSVIKKINKTELEQREAQVEGRMKRKMLALKQLFENGATEVIISDGRTEHPIKDALYGKGTLIK
ncbi:acetylglutamate kinase [Candidatus Woesearchaeota archaeon CG10_big_fil_rev_8_21_14_0_10_30_7]|nr:MAG: acetylglutamate kinase [Candidatus Woesearchaeota archaeon CG10_big_fil_rev_8_21_14_0_10_30_7]